MTPIDGPELRPEDTEKLMMSITPDNHIQNVKLNGGTDFGFAFGEKARFRVSVLKAKGNYGLVLRRSPTSSSISAPLACPTRSRSCSTAARTFPRHRPDRLRQVTTLAR